MINNNSVIEFQIIGCVKYKANHEEQVGDQLEVDNPKLYVAPFDFDKSFHRVIGEDLETVTLGKLFEDYVDVVPVIMEILAQVKEVHIQQAYLYSLQIELVAETFDLASDLFLI